MDNLLKTSMAALAAIGVVGAMAFKVEAVSAVIPDDARCVVKKADKTTYCTDKSGTPITGELRKYRDNVMLRQYPLQNGLLNGAAVTYDTRGRKRSEKEYEKGLLNGFAREYSSSGALESEISYVSGKKQGPAKYYNEYGGLLAQAEYADNRLNGNMRIYDEKGALLYGFKNENDKYVSGTYYYLTPGGGSGQTEIPAVIISALNHKCLELRKKKTTSLCAAVFDSANKSCNQNWRRQNRPAVRRYLAACAEGKSYE